MKPLRFILRLPAQLLLALAHTLIGCGTTAFQHDIEVIIEDPSRRLGTAPIEVSIFDRQMGYSRSWALKAAGPSSPERPYKTAYSSTATGLLSGAPPAQLVVSIAIPKLDDNGYFVLELEPRSGRAVNSAARYCAYGSYFPDQSAWSIPVQYRAEAGGKGWKLQLAVQIPGR